MNTSAVLLLIWALGLLALPSFAVPPKRIPFKTCKRSDPQLNACLADALQGSIPILTKGIRTLGVLPIDPLFVTEMNMIPGEGSVSVKVNYRNQRFIGFSKLKILSVKANLDPKDYRMEIDVVIPNLQIVGNYTSSGRVMFLPTYGNGNNNITLEDLATKAVLTGKTLMRDGEEFLEIEKFSIKFKAEEMYLKFDKLFNGDEVLSDNMNKFLNENWQPILEEMGPGFEEALGVIFKDLSNRIYLHVPFNQLYPE